MIFNGNFNSFILSIEKSFAENKENNAFFINGVNHKYSELSQSILNIRSAIKDKISDEEKIVGIIANDDLETYAAIFALWFEGKAYVPINPENPVERNKLIIQEALINTIIDSSNDAQFKEYNLIDSSKSYNLDFDTSIKQVDDKELVYILFTSGTTGKPKGVPISRENLNGFIDAFWDMGYDIDTNDRCLQMFELTFDLSVMSYLIPLSKGSCVYTIPKDKIKYSYIFELMEEQQLTVALMVPSILHYLRPYFDEIDLPLMKYSLFCGEALPLDITLEWSKCLPNARITNVYGPTEDTIFCTYYDYKRETKNKSHNGVLSIGKSMKDNFTVLIDENQNILSHGNSGELCLGGIQLTNGYWMNEEKNKEAFFYKDYKDKSQRFYKTGDLCIEDEEGDLLYLGRLDFQTKIQGFRVELSEIEYYAKEFLSKVNVVVLALVDELGNTELAMVIESKEFAIKDLIDNMKLKLPIYMIPKKIAFITTFPLNVNGKIDRKKLGTLFFKE